MSSPHLRIGFFLLLTTLLSWALPARAAYAPPPIAGHVTDTAHKLSKGEIDALNKKLADYRRCSGRHVAVFITASLEGQSVEDVAYVTFNTWKIGAAQKDNGVLLVLAPAERKIRIEVGKGVEGDLTDLESGRILREAVIPNLKADRFFSAADQATTRIANALGGCTMANVGGAAATFDPLATATPTPTISAPEPTFPASSYVPMKVPPPPNEHLPERYAMAGGLAFLVLLACLGGRIHWLIVGFPAGVAFFFSFSVMSDVGRPGFGRTNFDVDAASTIFFFGALILVCVNIFVWAHRWRMRNTPALPVGATWVRVSSSSNYDPSSPTAFSAPSSTSHEWSSSSSSNSFDSSSSSTSSSDYSGGGGSSGGGGASDSY